MGKSGWAVTRWTFDNTNVEPLFRNCGIHEIAAIGQMAPGGTLSVTWQFLDGIGHGRFEVKLREE